MMEGGEDEQLKPTNPFVLPPTNQTTLLDLAMEAVQLLTCRKTSGDYVYIQTTSHTHTHTHTNIGLYNITHKQGKIAQLLLHKQSFRMGDDILAECTFHHHAISCIQVCGGSSCCRYYYCYFYSFYYYYYCDKSPIYSRMIIIFNSFIF